MGAFVLVAIFGLLGVVGLSSGDDDVEPPIDPPPPDEPLTLTGTEGQVDMLIGGDADDTITGNINEADVLDGQGGDDLLIVRNGNTATGGAGADTFDVTDGSKATITDFTEGEDALQVLITPGNETPTNLEAATQVGWVMTDAGAELHDMSDAGAERSEATRILTLQGLTAPPTNITVQWQLGA